jgi:hypothetical protein
VKPFRRGVIQEVVKLLCPETLNGGPQNEIHVNIEKHSVTFSSLPRTGAEEGKVVVLIDGYVKEEFVLDESTPVATWEEVIKRHSEVVGKITTISYEIEKRRTEKRDGFREWERKAIGARDHLFQEIRAYRQLMSVKGVSLGRSDEANKKKGE